MDVAAAHTVKSTNSWLCYWAGLTSKVPWYPGPYWESTGWRERGWPTIMQKKHQPSIECWNWDRALSRTTSHWEKTVSLLVWCNILIYTAFWGFIKYKHIIIIRMKRNEGMEYFTLFVMNQ